MAEKKRFLTFLMSGIIVVCAGVLIIFFDQQFVKIIIVVSGLAMLIDGIYTLFNYKGWQFGSSSRTLALTKSVANILIGFVGVFLPFFISQNVLPVIVYILAAGFLYSSFVAFENAVVFHRVNKELNYSHFVIEGIISLLLAVLMIANPSAAIKTFVIILGVATIVFGVVLILLALRVRRLAKKVLVEEK